MIAAVDALPLDLAADLLDDYPDLVTHAVVGAASRPRPADASRRD